MEVHIPKPQGSGTFTYATSCIFRTVNRWNISAFRQILPTTTSPMMELHKPIHIKILSQKITVSNYNFSQTLTNQQQMLL
uniref:Uncharacterized protein n=1 Tax=Rhizophora mucronata TaxID=61149 RepID=A0A2P2QBC1_RHIMU